MFVISDTNILSTLAASAALPLLHSLYQERLLAIPPSVEDELRAALADGKTHIQLVLDAIATGEIRVIQLSAEEEGWTFTFPFKLGAGEREAIALAITRKAVLLTNDKEAISYGAQKGLVVVSLVSLLRSLWTEQLVSQDEVRQLIKAANEIERLRLSPNQLSVIFEPL